MKGTQNPAGGDLVIETVTSDGEREEAEATPRELVDSEPEQEEDMQIQMVLETERSRLLSESCCNTSFKASTVNQS